MIPLALIPSNVDVCIRVDRKLRSLGNAAFQSSKKQQLTKYCDKLGRDSKHINVQYRSSVKQNKINFRNLRATEGKFSSKTAFASCLDAEEMRFN